ncbi:MAG: methyl-accepting chemotaxis protein [Treponema sp.]|nr:methyl-accepting chemotaxis protein [Treponema sp.]MCL2236711.1 methyl-accepting chemotaxis protein [Treponema sp.]
MESFLGNVSRFFNNMGISSKLAVISFLFLLLLSVNIWFFLVGGNMALLVVCVIAVFFGILISVLTSLNLKKSKKNMLGIFEKLYYYDLAVNIDTLSTDEFGHFMIELNEFIQKLNSTFSSFNESANMVTTAITEITSNTLEITATANEQSASVSEIVSTMENNKTLSSQASEKTTEVAELAAQTMELSKRGADLRDYNEGMMLDIRNQNAKTIEIIKNLAEMLSRIDESIALIDTIADHTKLIAFNAALEASSSGEAGARFSVVAGEIRRFADNVVESASEIKERIQEVNEAAQTLLTEANSGTHTIDSGYNKMVEQKKVFEHIVEASENVAIRSAQISNLSKQQEYASAQVFSALKEISTGVNQFVSATALTSKTTEKLKKMAEEFNDTLGQYHITDRG